MSEGDPEGWAAAAEAISGRVRELGWRQRELAERSHVSLSVALGWEPEHLDRVLKGHARQPGGNTAPDSAALWSRLESFESRLAEILRLLTEVRSDVAAVTAHVRDD